MTASRVSGPQHDADLLRHRYVSPTPRHTSLRKERAIVGAARGRSASAIPDLEPIHPGVSDLNRKTPFGNSTRILSVGVAHLHCADKTSPPLPSVPITPPSSSEPEIRANEGLWLVRADAREMAEGGLCARVLCARVGRQADELGALLPQAPCEVVVPGLGAGGDHLLVLDVLACESGGIVR